MKAKSPTDRSFGITGSVLLLIGAALAAYYQSFDWRWLVSASCILLLIALLAPICLRPFNKLWMGFGYVLSLVTNPIVLGAIFFLVIMPIGLCLRVAGKNPLRLRRNDSLSTYWMERSSDHISTRFNDQF